MLDKYSTRKKLKELSGLAGVLIIIMIFYTVTGIGCPIRFFLGISCPGCGMTRAVISACCMNFTAAVQYHPLCFFLPIPVFVYLCRERMNKNIYKIFWFCVIVIFICVYIVRLLDPQNRIVTVGIENGVVYKVIQWILGSN